MARPPKTQPTPGLTSQILRICSNPAGACLREIQGELGRSSVGNRYGEDPELCREVDQLCFTRQLQCNRKVRPVRYYAS